MTESNEQDVGAGLVEVGVSHSVPSASDPTCPPFRLLVVDDEISIREVTSAMLGEQGYEVLTAEDGQQALEILPQFRPDLVITDLTMPRLSGFELLEIMRDRFSGVPVIAVSGEFSGSEPPPSLSANAFVPKDGNYIGLLGLKIKELLRPAVAEIEGEL
jgi:chemosensory pili system protein ChpA (sensor histidine kinase/response regulator)